MEPEDKANSVDNSSTDENEGNNKRAYTTTTNNDNLRGSTNAKNDCDVSVSGEGAHSTTAENRRATFKEVIERYFYQLVHGCGKATCTNAFCVSSGMIVPMVPNQAAAEALKLFAQDAQLCYSRGSSSSINNEAITQSPQQCSSTAVNSNTLSSNLNSACTSASSSRRTSNTSPLTSSTIGTNSTSNTTTTNATNSATNSSSNATRATNGFFRELAFNAEQTPALNFPSNERVRQQQTQRVRANVSGGADSAENKRHRPARQNVTNAEASRATTKASDAATSKQTLPEMKATSSTPSSSLGVVNHLSFFDLQTPISTMLRAVLSANYLNETLIDALIEQGRADGEYSELLYALSHVFGSLYRLSRSFRRSNSNKSNNSNSSAAETKLHELLGKPECDLKKEDLRSMEGENEKDVDSTQCADDNGSNQHTNNAENDELNATNANATTMTHVESALRMLYLDCSLNDDSESTAIASDFANLKGTSDTLVDFQSLRRVKAKLSRLKNTVIGKMLTCHLVLLTELIDIPTLDWEQIVHCLIICFDLLIDGPNECSSGIMTAQMDLFENSLPKLCQIVYLMPIEYQARLTRIWSVHCKDKLYSIVQCCQQMISINVYVFEADVQELMDVKAATVVLKLAYCASILAGEMDPPINPILNDVKENETASSSDPRFLSTQQDEEIELFNIDHDSGGSRSQNQHFAEDKLAEELNLNAMHCRAPVVPFVEFYNEPLSDNIQMDRDYLNYKRFFYDVMPFSFMFYSFILTPATKVVGLYYDCRIRMYSEGQLSMFDSGDNDDLNSSPELKLEIRRDNIVNDALVGLELLAMSNPKNLKKQLVIKFVGEQGVDEGGVSKEFFQLIVDKIFNVDFGMFMEMEETQTCWFNPLSFENVAQFTMIGIIIGLAIYNGIILAVRFPMVVYRKLMGAEGVFNDLKDFSPTLHSSLQSMLDYMDDDMEDVFMQTFKISYKNVFGDVVEHELKPGGADIFVNQTNKQDFVDLYADFLLNRNIRRQFEAFKKGFDMVTDESPLRLLFRPEEVELLVCGSKQFDFVELEQSTEYAGGYSKDTPIIEYFWEIVHLMPEESKRKLLEFTTGSDRVPVGGFSRLKLMITRQGPDCERLPTSHTCFNILLLPEYSSKEKLEERLLKAITYSKGFGMI